MPPISNIVNNYTCLRKTSYVNLVNYDAQPQMHLVNLNMLAFRNIITIIYEKSMF